MSPLPTLERVAGRSQTAARYAVAPLGARALGLEDLVINGRGEIAGVLRDGKGEYACLWKAEKLIRLPGLGGRSSAVSAINNRGQVAGSAEDWRGRWHPVLWTNGRQKDLGALGRTVGEATDINDRGDMVGTLYEGQGIRQGFLYRKGRFRRIRVQPGLVVLAADAINNRGVIAGRVAARGANPLESTVRTCLIKNGRAMGYGPLKDAGYSDTPAGLTDTGMVVGNSPQVEANTVFTILRGKYSALEPDFFHGVRAVNSAGQYVGWHCRGNIIQQGPYRAILWQDGGKDDLNELIPRETGWVLERATGINNRGVIVGTGTHNGHRRAFKLTPRS